MTLGRGLVINLCESFWLNPPSSSTYNFLFSLPVNPPRTQES